MDPRMRTSTPVIAIAVALLAVGCEQLGFEDPAKLAAMKEAEGKAIGSACRQSGRAIEDCYDLNPKAQKAAVFAGWKEMDGYMRENKMESAIPQVAEAPKTAKGESKAEDKAVAEKAEAKDKEVKVDKKVEKKSAKM